MVNLLGKRWVSLMQLPDLSGYVKLNSSPTFNQVNFVMQ